MKKLLLFILLFFSFNVVYAKEGKVEVKLAKCVDGDTAHFMVDNEKVSTRFIAIDTPESVHPNKDIEPFGKEASDYTCKALQDAKKIELEYDPKSEEKDKYGRAIAWVYVDDTLLQDTLIKKGYAKVAYLYDDYLYTDKLEESQKVAKSEQLGIWHDYETAWYQVIIDFFIDLFDWIISFIDDLLDNML